MRIIREIIIVCSDTPANTRVSPADIVNLNKNGHPVHNPYHYIIQPDGDIERGRPIYSPGNIFPGHNAHSLCVCLAGGIDSTGAHADTRTKGQTGSLNNLVGKLIKMYRCPVKGLDEIDGRYRNPYFSVKKSFDCLYKMIVLGRPSAQMVQ